VGEKVQELTTVTGVAGVGEERDRGSESTVNRGRWRGSEGQRWDRAAAELELIGAVVRAAGVRESGIGWVCELQWVAVVLLEHWIAGGKRQRWLMTSSKSCSGAPARRSAREEERQWKCECVKARVSSQGAQGRALGPEEGTGMREQLPATGGVRGMLGRRRCDVEGRGEGQQRPESSGRGEGEARGAGKSGAGQLGSGNWPARAAGSGIEKNRERRGWRLKTRTDLRFSKKAGTPL
jgi:hypothetical protein